MHKHAREKLHCVVCTTVIPDERILREAVTCSKQCGNQLRNIRRRKRDMKKCRYCSQPSTPEERKLFQKWRETIEGKKRKRGRPLGSKKKPPADPAQAEFTEMITVH